MYKGNVKVGVRWSGIVVYTGGWDPLEFPGGGGRLTVSAQRGIGSLTWRLDASFAWVSGGKSSTTVELSPIEYY